MIEDEVDEDGLTEQEREFLTTPFSQMKPADREHAMRIRDKRDQHRWAENAKHREQRDHERQSQLA